MKKMMMLLPLFGLAACSMPQPTQYQYSQYQCGEEMLAITYDAQADMVQFPYAGVYHRAGSHQSAKETASYSDGVTHLLPTGRTGHPGQERRDSADL